MVAEDRYQAQKKYLKSKKRLSVWMEPDKYDAFKAAVEREGKTIYAVIHCVVDEYLERHQGRSNSQK